MLEALFLHPLVLKYVIAPFAVILVLVGAYNYIYHRGVVDNENRHVLAQAKEERDLERKYAKIHDSVPLDKPTAIKFMLHYASK